MDDAAERFQEHRPLLLGVAYRLLGSMWEPVCAWPSCSVTT